MIYTSDDFFANVPDGCGKRCELINGRISALESAPSSLHQRIVGEIFGELRNHIKSNKGKCKPFVAPYDVKIDFYNVVQPDVLVVCDDSKLDGKRCNGAPDFVAEVLSADRSKDMFTKTKLYKAAGVREYWIVDPLNEKVIVYFFEETDIPNLYNFNYDIPVRIFDGELTINIADLLK